MKDKKHYIDIYENEKFLFSLDLTEKMEKIYFDDYFGSFDINE